MQLGLGIILSFLILLPGFGLYGSIFTKLGRQGLDPIPPAPSSILTLLIISTGALLGHLFLSTIIVINSIWCNLTNLFFTVNFEPDVYRIITTNETGIYSAGIIVILLLIDLLITLLVFAVGKWMAKHSITKHLISRLRYGALSDLLTKIEPEARFATAFILTKIERNSGTEETDIIGYEGVLDDLIYDKSEIQAVHISDCTAFYLRQKRDGLSKIDISPDKKKIPFLYFPKEEIRNISFTVFEEAETPEAPD